MEKSKGLIMSKKKVALFLGRFQPFHNGHLRVVEYLSKNYDEVIIAVCSAQYAMTKRNPFTYFERHMMIEDTLSMLDIKNYRISCIIDNQTNLHLNPEENIYFTYNISFAGYMEINFTSTNNILIWIGGSKTNPEYYTRFPSYPNTAYSGSFLVPVAGDYVYINFNNPNEIGGSTIDFSVKYIY